jgi:hypothetical protein
MSRVTFGKVEVRGTKYEIHIGDDGKFMVEVDGVSHTAPTLDSLKKRLNEVTRIKQKNIAIPFIMWEEKFDKDGEIRHGVCVGIHAGNGNFMVKLDGGDAHQFPRWQNDGFFNPKAEKRLIELHKALSKATNDLEKFAKENKLNLLRKITELIGQEEKP